MDWVNFTVLLLIAVVGLGFLILFTGLHILEEWGVSSGLRRWVVIAGAAVLGIPLAVSVAAFFWLLSTFFRRCWPR